jgi:hypothetical protein
VDQSVGVLEIMTRALFLRSSRVQLTLLGQCEMLSRTRTARGNVHVVYMDRRRKCICHVYQVSLYGVHQFKSP